MLSKLNKAFHWVLCRWPTKNNFLYHSYTSRSLEHPGEDIPQEYIDAGILGFWEYAALRCKYCGRLWPESAKNIEDAKCQRS